LTKTGYIYLSIQLICDIIIKIVIWLSTILITFILLEYFLNNNILKLKTNIKEQEKKDFIIAKAKLETSNNESIIDNKKKIDIINHKDKIIGKEIVKKEEEMIEELAKNKEKKEYEKFLNSIL
jgi:flagellar biosynthesis/type III secretory pathway M-ring protein FliF/YscJ